MNTPTNPAPSAADNAPTPRTMEQIAQECAEKVCHEGCLLDRGVACELIATAIAQAVEQKDCKIANQAERIRYLEGATNHATGTPLSKAKAERDALRAEVEHIKAWANAKADEAQDLRATLLAREGELDAMSAALAAKDREIKEERKRTATQEHVKNGVYMLADAWKARAEKAEAELASMRNRTPFLELSKCEQELFAAERDAAEAKRLLEADGKIRLHIVAERDQLHARVADLERQLAEAGKDKERIDWLENQGHLIARQYRDGWHFDASNGAWVCVNATTLRAAIDSAREAQP